MEYTRKMQNTTSETPLLPEGEHGVHEEDTEYDLKDSLIT
jgi:hypothetical protein